MIKLVDCTLRDGGHLNKSNFGEKVIHKIIDNLVSSKVDIIEIGFLKNQEYKADTTIFNNIAEAKNVIKESRSSNIEYSLMAQEDQYDVSKLEPCDGIINHIRVSFHNYDFNEGIEFCREVIKKGYQCHVNPINLQGYSDKELIDIITIINDLKPYTFTIVDTFGAMIESDLNRIVSIVDHNLRKEINIGLHLHENLGLSFSLSQFFVKTKPPTRNISIDASLNGMGRVPGNLNIELIMDHLNRVYNSNYNINPIFDVIDDCILPIKKEITWGYSLPYALSAQHKLHRTYAEYLLSRAKLKTNDIQNILSCVEDKQKAIYNKDYIQNLYINYLCNEFDDSSYISNLKNELKCGRSFLLLAPGESLNFNIDKIKKFIKDNNPIIIAVHFSPKSMGINTDYVFFSNPQRYEKLELENEKLIITSNVLEVVPKAQFVINFANLILKSEDKCDNALILLLELFLKLDIKSINIAGFDGFKKGHSYFNKDLLSNYDSMSDKYDENDKIKDIILRNFSDIKINTLTSSSYIEVKYFV